MLMSCKRLVICAIGVLAVWPGSMAWAQNLKVGYVNVVKVIEKAPQGDAALKKLESEFGPRDRALRATNNKIQKLEDELDKNELVLKDSERREKEKQVRDLRRKLKRETQEFREDYSVRRNEELRTLEKIVHKVIVEIAKNERYQLIVHQGVVYADNQIDITEKVLKNLSAKFSATSKK